MVFTTQLPGRRARRLLLNLSLALFAMFACIPIASAQQGDVILLTRQVSVGTALEEINHQTGYKIVADMERFDQNRSVLFTSNRLSVSDLLAQTLKGTGFTWRVDGNHIIITSAPPEAVYWPEYSTMYRNKLPQEMYVVVDPLARNNMTAEELHRIRNGYWRKDGTDSLGLAVMNFRVNVTKLEPGYMTNQQTIDMMNRTFANKDLLAAMDFMVITGAASPEGYTAANHKLAADRAMATKNFIMEKYPFMDRDRIYTFAIGEDWSGLWKMVWDDYSVPMRESVLHILEQESSGDQKRAALKALDNGRVYRYIVDNMLPSLRGAAACLIYLKEDPQPQILVDTVRLVDTIYIHTHSEIEIERIDTVNVKRPNYYAVKTNLLADGILIPNLAFEYDLGNRWSIEVEGHWAWWNTRRTHKNCWRFQEVGVEMRKWLGNKERTPLTGHYLGLYGAAGTYDVRFGGRTGNLSDMSYSFGISYGYSMPIVRSWNLEFGIGLGYMGGEYQRYEYNEEFNCFPWLSDERRHYFGPTKAKVSLVWLIGKGKNEEKESRINR